MMSREVDVVVAGGGVVGCAAALALARRGASVVLVEALPGLGLQASGTNSGILHTGFDSRPGDLETELILRSAALRDPIIDALGVPVLRCGAVLRPRDESELDRVDALAGNARANGVDVARGPQGELLIPGESVTDPVAFTLGLAGAAIAAGAEIFVDTTVDGLERDGDTLVVRAGDHRISTSALVNCAGLGADDIAHLGGDTRFTIRPRKGEFLVFDAPRSGPLDAIRLPVPSATTKGLLLFPTVHGQIVCGPTAHDQDDEHDWSVRPSAEDELRDKLAEVRPDLAGVPPIGRYAGLRPAGVGSNYIVEHAPSCPGLVHAAAIRSTGLTAAIGIAERLCELAAELGVVLGEPAPVTPGPPPPGIGLDGPWWARTADFVARAGA
jgi:glycerol-3-phosphate dehydrogenase